jgi:hypothetical protein
MVSFAAVALAVAVVVATPSPIETRLSFFDRSEEVRVLRLQRERVSAALERATTRYARELQERCPSNVICDGATPDQVVKLGDRYREIDVRLAELCRPLAEISKEQRAACDA